MTAGNVTTVCNRKLIPFSVFGVGLFLAAPVHAYPEFDPRGRVHLDAAVHDADEIPLSDRVINRRARLGVSGDLDPDWSFVIEFDFAEEGTDATDVKLSRSVGGGTITVGQFYVPMGLEYLASSNDMMFIERTAISNVVTPGRRLGIGYDSDESPVKFAMMAYGRAIGDDIASGQDMRLGVGGRLVFSPQVVEGHLIHLGVSAAYENRRDETDMRFRDRPGARPADVRLIDTQTVDGVDSTAKVGVELAYQVGPFSVQAEYMSVSVSRDNGGSPRFDGYYVQAGYILTGETRGYRDGLFRGVTPVGGAGAWEVAARYSHIDLNDAQFRGGEQSNVTLGVNWYVTTQVRFMANVIFVTINDSDALVAVGDDVFMVGDESPRIALFRAQYSF